MTSEVGIKTNFVFDKVLSGEEVVEEKKGGQDGAKEMPAKPADKEATKRVTENSDKGNSSQKISDETMAQFSGTSKEVGSKFLFKIVFDCHDQELVSEVVGLRRSVEDQGKKLTDLENYIDTLVSQSKDHVFLIALASEKEISTRFYALDAIGAKMKSSDLLIFRWRQ